MILGMNQAASEPWTSSNFSQLLTLSCRTANTLLIAGVLMAIRSSAEDVEIPDYFGSPATQQQSPSANTSFQVPTESDAEDLLSTADDALEKLAQGDTSAAASFASVFDEIVDYYDEGSKTPQQISQEKAAIFRSYRRYSTQHLGSLTLDDTDRPNVKWVTFTYHYEITKKSGTVLQGVANARWELQKVNGKVSVIATRETVQRQ
jgi:hypothetical protein